MTPRFAGALAALVAAASAPGLWAGAARGASAARPDETDSCVACHRDPRFLVTHPKLYNYYRDWERSVHRDAGVGCADCHGGNPEAPGKDEAHAVSLRGDSARSPVNFANVHETCGACHGEIQGAYVESPHYEQLVEGDGETRGPSCVTCHSSVSTVTLDVTTVEDTCSRCHDQKSGIDPEVPARARSVLNKFLSIDRFHRYVAVRMEPAESKPFLEKVDRRMHELSVLWHTFDLDAIEEQSNEVLDLLRAKRDEIRERRSSRGIEAKPPPGDATSGGARLP